MKIDIGQSTLLRDICPGDTFAIGHEIYMRVAPPGGLTTCIRLTDGVLYALELNIKVQPIKLIAVRE